MVLMWWILGAVSLVTACFALLILFSIMLSERTRRSSFNLYFAGCMIPEVVLTSTAVAFFWASATARGFRGSGWCRLEAWSVVFGFGGNAWMNLCIIRQVHKMLQYGHARRRFSPPVKRQIFVETAAVYVWVSFLGILALLPEARLPIRILPTYGVVCIAQKNYDIGSTLFFFFVFFPLVSGIPLVYTAHVLYDMYWGASKLLQTQSTATRHFATYFLRMVLVFFIWWFPSLLCVHFITRTPPWFKFAWTVWCHLQAIATGCLALTKSDIRQAVRRLLTGQSLRTGLERARSSQSWLESLQALWGARSEESTKSIKNNEV